MEDWSTLSADVIDAVVCHLKRTENWKANGPCLRILNGHWCSAVNQHVVEIRPKVSRELTAADIDGLAQFTNLTSLDAVPFEGKDGSALEDRCLRLARALSRCPRLKHLRVNYFLEMIRETDPQRLKSVEAIEFENDRCFDDDSSITPPVSEMGERTLSSFRTRDNFLVNMSSLKVLLMKRGHNEVRKITLFLGGMRRGQGIENHLNSRDEMKASIKCSVADLSPSPYSSVKIPDHIPKTLEWIAGYLNLKSLDVRICNMDVSTTAAVEEILKGLTSLKLRGESSSLLNLDFRKATSLESLSLDYMTITQEFIDILQTLPLKRLTFVNCGLPDVNCFPRDWTMLEHLDVHRSQFHLYVTIPYSLPQNLTSFAASFDRGEGSTLFNEIRNLRSLESLWVENYRSPVSFDFLETLGDLPRLRSLYLRGFDKGLFMQLGKMEWMKKLEELTFRVYVHEEDHRQMEDIIERLKMELSNVKVDDEIRRTYRRNRCHV